VADQVPRKKTIWVYDLICLGRDVLLYVHELDNKETMMINRQFVSNIKARFMKRYIEIILVTVGAIILYVTLAYFSLGGPVGKDITLYMNLGLNGLKSTLVYNRYFHILLEAIFLKAAPTPLLGVQYYWAFLITGSCLFIYLGARLFSDRSNPLHGLLSVALFLSIATIADSVGDPQVDDTAMFIVALLVLIYILSARSGHRSKWMIGLFGFLFYLAIKTKETTLPVVILTIGMGFIEGNRFSKSVLRRNILYLISGVLVGIAFFSLWTWIAIGDPLFGLRLSEFREYFSSYVQGGINGAPLQTGLTDWFTGYFFTSLLIPFLLYVVSGVKTTEQTTSRRLVWLVPLVILCFVSFTVGNRFGFQDRFVYPAIPVICLLGTQFLDFNLPADTKGWKEEFLWIVVGAALILVLRILFRVFLPVMKWNTMSFIYVIFDPFLLACILSIIFLIKNPRLRTSIIISLLVAALLLSPLIRNYKIIFRSNSNREAMSLILYPFSAFSSEIVYSPAMHMFIAKDTWDIVGNPYFTSNVDAILDTFNIYFDVNSTRTNFIFTVVDPGKYADIVSADYSYIIITKPEWEKMSQLQQVVSVVNQNYQMFFEPKGILVLLKAR